MLKISLEYLGKTSIHSNNLHNLSLSKGECSYIFVLEIVNHGKAFEPRFREFLTGRMISLIHQLSFCLGF